MFAEVSSRFSENPSCCLGLSRVKTTYFNCLCFISLAVVSSNFIDFNYWFADFNYWLVFLRGWARVYCNVAGVSFLPFSVLVCPLFVLLFGLSSDYIGWCGLLFKFLIYPGDDDDDGVTLILN